MAETQHRWTLDDGARHHAVVVETGGWRRKITWLVDDQQVAEARSAEDTVVLTDDDAGAVRLTFTMLGRPRRVTWFEPGEDSRVRGHTGLGGIDMDPEPGSAAAKREERMRSHPRWYAARHVVAGIAKVVGPMLFALAAIRFTGFIDLPGLPLPDLPRPNLPGLPAIPWPGWPDLSLPAWVQTVLGYLKYVWPVLLGIALAYAEITRRRRSDVRKEELRLRRQQSDEPAG